MQLIFLEDVAFRNVSQGGVGRKRHWNLRLIGVETK